VLVEVATPRLAPEGRAPGGRTLPRKIFSGVRRIFIFLLGAAIITFIVWHQNEIHSVVAQKINRAVNQFHSQSESAPLRENALSYEKEVNEAAGK